MREADRQTDRQIDTVTGSKRMSLAFLYCPSNREKNPQACVELLDLLQKTNVSVALFVLFPVDIA